ncbi:MAG: hypothetical protein ACRD2B_16095, partial [Terriglobia bacterium]
LKGGPDTKLSQVGSQKTVGAQDDIRRQAGRRPPLLRSAAFARRSLKVADLNSAGPRYSLHAPDWQPKAA